MTMTDQTDAQQSPVRQKGRYAYQWLDNGKTIRTSYDTSTFSNTFYIFLHFVIWISSQINSVIDLTNFMIQHFLLGVLLNMI